MTVQGHRRQGPYCTHEQVLADLADSAVERGNITDPLRRMRFGTGLCALSGPVELTLRINRRYHRFMRSKCRGGTARAQLQET